MEYCLILCNGTDCFLVLSVLCSVSGVVAPLRRPLRARAALRDGGIKRPGKPNGSSIGSHWEAEESGTGRVKRDEDQHGGNIQTCPPPSEEGKLIFWEFSLFCSCFCFSVMKMQISAFFNELRQWEQTKLSGKRKTGMVHVSGWCYHWFFTESFCSTCQYFRATPWGENPLPSPISCVLLINWKMKHGSSATHCTNPASMFNRVREKTSWKRFEYS